MSVHVWSEHTIVVLFSFSTLRATVTKIFNVDAAIFVAQFFRFVMGWLPINFASDLKSTLNILVTMGLSSLNISICDGIIKQNNDKHLYYPPTWRKKFKEINAIHRVRVRTMLQLKVDTLRRASAVTETPWELESNNKS